ncbi:MAG: DUF4132 domain-containing protein [Sandaracinaceae bacterium]|nr:DUF4132 domain-containing protein [Sandaracinaceae bacterium]
MRPVVWEHAGAEIVWDPASLRRLLPSRVHRLVAGAPVDDVVALTLETIATVEATPTRLSAPVAIEVVRLRAALVAASDAEYAAARDAALPFVERADPIRLGCLAGAFTAERAWTERAIRGYLAKGARPARLAELVGPFVTDPRLAEQLAVATAASPRGVAPFAHDVVAHLGFDAVGPLRAMLLGRFSDSSVDVVARALGRIGSDAAGRVLMPLAAVRPLRPRAVSWAKRHPERAVRILTSLIDEPTDEALDLAEASDIRSPLEALLGELAPAPPRRSTEWPRETPAPLREAAKRPAFLVPERLPRLTLRDGRELPEAAVLGLARLLREPDEAELRAVRGACDPDRLAEVAMALFEQWLAHGADAKASWAVMGLGHFGRDAQIEQLLPYLAEWQQRGAHRRAGTLLDAIATMGTEAALFELDRVARKDRYRKLRARATEAVAKAGAALGLSGEELEDRLAPTLGLDARGATSLDLGGRTLAVTFDETLTPRVGGRATFPRRRVSDDPALHAEASARFRALRKKASEVAEQQVTRLERMMIHERDVSLADFHEHFVMHPLVRHLVTRLVWGAYDRTFRVADDGSLADVEDDAVELRPGARVRLPHTLRLSEEARIRWAEVLADYELVQPFEQLGRRVYVPSAEERRAAHLLRSEGRVVDWPALVRLERAGFVRSTRDGLRYTNFDGSVAGAAVRVVAHPGLHVGDPTGSGEQRLVEVSVPRLEALPEVIQSEVCRALALHL